MSLLPPKMSAQACILLFAAFSFIVPLHAQTLKESSPAAAGFSAQKLKGLDTMIQSYIDNKYIGGATAIVARDGKIVYYKALGYDNITTKEALKRDEIFRIASQTKAVTSVAVMMLVEEGKLKLDDPVSKYISEYKNQVVLDSFHAADTTYTSVPVKRDITIHDLLTHSSGIDYSQIGSDAATAIYSKAGIPAGIGIDNVSMQEKMKLLGKLPLMHQPGEKWTYGLNMDLLGYLIEVISGLSLDTFFQQKIFAPLGMNDTYFYLPKNKYKRLVGLTTEDSTGHIVPAPDTFDLNGVIRNDYPITDGHYLSGGGGLSSTAFDYAVFMQMLLNKGVYNGKRILKPESVAKMTTSQLPDVATGDTEFGLGFGIFTKKSMARSPLPPGTYGWGGFFSSVYWIDPQEKIVGQLFLNQFPNSHREIHEKFQQMVYDALIKK